MIGIIYRRLIDLLGGKDTLSGDQMVDLAQTAADSVGIPIPKLAPPEGGIMKVSPGPTIIMMCGLQGSGKTTTCGKLAAYLKKRGRSVMLAAADLQRPAAVEQLQTVAETVQRDMPGGATVSFYAEPDKVAAYGKAVGVAVGVCQRALIAAQKAGVDTLILDTAGRLHVNDELMNELAGVNRNLRPHHIFLVVDAMTGQDAVNSAKSFHERLTVDGLILTKFDSDTRGGAALSVKTVTGAAIKFIGIGEKLDAIEEFHAERIAGRILGMGDVVSLVEKAQQEVSQEEAEKLQDKLAKGEMTMDDFLGQLKALRRMGPLKQLMGLIPGVGSALKNAQVDDKQLDRIEAMINSMTKKERLKPSEIDYSRRRRIAGGSGTKDNDVGQLVKQFTTLNKLSKSMSSMGTLEKIKAVKEMGPDGMGGLVPGVKGLPGFSTKGSTAAPSIKNKFKKRR
jgi:signal recognition particle subunit SRP54